MNEREYSIYLDIPELEEFAVFCGAGISKNSGLPLANELKKYILRNLPIDKIDIDKIMRFYLPFELFMETISNYMDISKILEIFKEGEPNTNHILIARLAKNGYLKTIFTTNFDLLIEKALEKEGLKENIDFERYYSEEHFSETYFDKPDDKIKIIKIHGSADNEKTIRTTLEAVANKILSDKRVNPVNFLFSNGNHKKVLIFGYSCSDEFDITPQIQNIEGNKKEIILVQHSNVEKIEGLREINNKNPFKRYSGIRIKCNTDRFIENIWHSFQEVIGEYEDIKSETAWKNYVDDWKEDLEKNKGYNLAVAGFLFYNTSNFKKAIEYFERALVISEEIEDKEGKLKFYMALGNCYYIVGNSKKAIEYNGKSLEIAKEIGHKESISACYLNLGIAYDELEDFKKAIEYNGKSLEVAEEIGDGKMKSRCYTNLGISYLKLGDIKRALEYNGKSLEIAKRIGFKEEESRCYMNFGNIYSALRDFEKAIEYGEKTLENSKRIGYKVGESGGYYDLGTAYYGLGDFEKAIEYFEKALAISREIGHEMGETTYYCFLGSINYEKENFEKAIEYFEKALAILRGSEKKRKKVMCYLILGAIHQKTGEFEKAIEYFEEALEITREIGLKLLELICRKSLATTYRNLGDHKKTIVNYFKLWKYPIIFDFFWIISNLYLFSFKFEIVHWSFSVYMPLVLTYFIYNYLQKKFLQIGRVL